MMLEKSLRERLGMFDVIELPPKLLPIKKDNHVEWVPHIELANTIGINIATKRYLAYDLAYRKLIKASVIYNRNIMLYSEKDHIVIESLHKCHVFINKLNEMVSNDSLT